MKKLIFPQDCLVVLLAFFLLIFIASLALSEEKADNPPSIDLGLGQEKALIYQEERLGRERQELEQILFLLKERLEKETDNLRELFAEIGTERFAKDESVSRWTSVSLEVVIMQEKDGVSVLFPDSPANKLVWKTWQIKDFHRCINLLKEQYSRLGQGEKKTLLVKAIFSRFPEPEVRFPCQELLEKQIKLIEAQLRANEKQRRETKRQKGLLFPELVKATEHCSVFFIHLLII